MGIEDHQLDIGKAQPHHQRSQALAQQFEPPAIVVIGDIVAVREQLLGAFVPTDEAAS